MCSQFYCHISESTVVVCLIHKPSVQPQAMLQGFASGSLDDDAFAPRFFVDQGLEVMVSQSYSKNLGELHTIMCTYQSSSHTGSICCCIYMK